MPVDIGAHDTGDAQRKGSMWDSKESQSTKATPPMVPTQVDRNRRPVTSVGLRSCASSARLNSSPNWVHQLRPAHPPASDLLLLQVRCT